MARLVGILALAAAVLPATALAVPTSSTTQTRSSTSADVSVLEQRVDAPGSSDPSVLEQRITTGDSVLEQRVESAREDELFGDGDRQTSDAREDGLFATDQEDAPGGSREEDLFGDDGDTRGEARDGVLDRMTDRLGDLDDTLDIGGSLWLQGEYRALSSGSPKDFQFASPNFMDLYLDARPNDRVRAFINGRLLHDFTVADGAFDPLTQQTLQATRVLLDQVWLKFDVARAIFFTFGKQRIRWGSGRIWQPTDFLNQQRLNPIAIFDQRLGVGLLKLHIPIESLGWNFYAIANFDGATTLGGVGGALRAEIVYGTTELILSAAVRRDNPLRLGADVSTAIWWFDVSAELSLQNGLEDPFYRGEPNFEDGVGIEDLGTWEEFSREDDWIPQLRIGADISIPYSSDDNITLGFEYLFNDLGYDNRAIYPVLFFNGAFRPFYAGRHYLSVFMLLLAPGSLDDTSVFLTGIGNLSDRSFLSRLQVVQRVLTFLSVNVYTNVHFGSPGELRLGIDIPPSPDVAGTPLDFLTDGFSIVPPLFELGVALTLSL